MPDVSRAWRLHTSIITSLPPGLFCFQRLKKVTFSSTFVHLEKTIMTDHLTRKFRLYKTLALQFVVFMHVLLYYIVWCPLNLAAVRASSLMLVQLSRSAYSPARGETQPRSSHWFIIFFSHNLHFQIKIRLQHQSSSTELAISSFLSCLYFFHN